MPGDENEQVLVRIHLGESKTADRRPVYQQVIELLRTEGLAAATVLKGCVGFGHDRAIHAATIECVAADLPIVIETVDAPEHVEHLLRKLDTIMAGGLVMTEPARVIRYGSGL
jgi:PII-like signaling protein